MLALQAVDNSNTKARRVMSLATQNLGIWCFEQLVQRYSESPELIVMQGGNHYADIRTSRRGVRQR